MTLPRELISVQDAVWNGSIPLEIRLAPTDCRTYDKSEPYMIQCPRLFYLPFLLPQLQAFFKTNLIHDAEASAAWFSFEEIPLKWQYPLGLLFDLFSGSPPAHGAAVSTRRERPESHTPSPARPSKPEASVALPWQLVLHFSEFPDSLLVRLDAAGRVLHDAFINSVKEADFLRNGTANAIMKLSKDDSTKLWDSVVNYDRSNFLGIHNRLLPSSREFRNIPLRVYLPSTPNTGGSSAPSSPPGSPPVGDAKANAPTHLKVVQPLVASVLAQTGAPQTVGTALHAALPSLFPSRKTPIQAHPVLHGAVLPMNAPLEDLLRAAAYMDGWLHIGIEMHG